MNEMELSLFQKLVMCFCVLSLFLPFYCGGFSLYFWVLCILEFYFISCHMCVRVCDCVHIHAHICIHTNICIHTRTCVSVCMHVCAQLCLTVCDTLGYSPPGSSVHGISQARYWSRLPCPSPGDLLDPGFEPVSLASPSLAGGFFTSWATRQGIYIYI